MKQKVKLQDFLHFAFLSSLSFSPRGTRYGWLTHTFDLPADGYQSDFYIAENGKPRLVKRGISAYCWLDETTIAFPALAGEAEKSFRARGGLVTSVFSLNVLTGEERRLFSVPLNVGELHRFGDRFVLSTTVSLTRPDVEAMDAAEADAALKRLQKDQDYLIFDEHPFWINGKGFVNKTRSALFSCAPDGSGLTRLSPELMDVAGCFALGDDLVFFGSEYETYRTTFQRMYRVPLQGGAAVTVVKDGRFSIRAACAYDGRIVMAASENKRFGASENPCFYRVPADGGEPELFSDPDLSVACSVGTDCRYGGGTTFKADGNQVYFISTIRDNACLCVLDPAGAVSIIPESGTMDFFDVYDGRLVSICMKGLRLEEVYEGLAGGHTRQISELNEEYYRSTELSIPERFTFANRAGVELDGWIMKPPGFDPAASYPAIMNMHGGPKAAYGSIYYHEMQVWAAQGYVVFFCNPRGSDGKGNAFARVDGRFGTIDYEDFMDFTDEVLRRCPFIDKTRLGLTGGSYGGYLTNYIIGQTDRFKAAVAQRSVSSWLTTIFTCDGGFHLTEDQLDGADIWNDASWQKLWDMSPIKYADRVKTPTLFIHSEFDFRTWIVEGLMMYGALVYHGVPARMHIFKGENHNLSRSGRPSHRVRRLEEISAWFEKYL